MRCIPPLGERGYNSQPPDTKTVAGNGVLTYTCMDPTAYAGTTAGQAHEVRCNNATGEFATGWPPCTTRELSRDSIDMLMIYRVGLVVWQWVGLT